MSHSNAIKKENNENFQIIYGSEAIQPIQLISFNEKKGCFFCFKKGKKNI